MPENNTSAQQAQHNNISVGTENGLPPRRRRRSKKKKSNIKKYFEWALWVAVVAFFIITVAMLLTEATKKDNPFKDKKGASIENHLPAVPAA